MNVIIFINIVFLLYVLFFVPYSPPVLQKQKFIRFNFMISSDTRDLFTSVDQDLWTKIETDIETLLQDTYEDKNCLDHLRRIEQNLNRYVLKDIYDLKIRRQIKIEVENILTSLERLLKRTTKQYKVLEHNFSEYFDT